MGAQLVREMRALWNIPQASYQYFFKPSKQHGSTVRNTCRGLGLQYQQNCKCRRRFKSLTAGWKVPLKAFLPFSWCWYFINLLKTTSPRSSLKRIPQCHPEKSPSFLILRHSRLHCKYNHLCISRLIFLFTKPKQRSHSLQKREDCDLQIQISKYGTSRVVKDMGCTAQWTCCSNQGDFGLLISFSESKGKFNVHYTLAVIHSHQWTHPKFPTLL